MVAAPPSPAVQVRGLCHAYRGRAGDVTVLDGVDLDVATGASIAILGRSGSGKSTLLSLLGGLMRQQTGSIDVLGHDLAALGSDDLARFRSREVGFVFQHFGLLDTLTAAENVELAGTLGGLRATQRRDRAHELLGAVGLADRAGHRPAALSGGERQRVAIARALVNEPRLVLADEPTGNLDDESADVVAALLCSIPERTGAAVVVVTHDHGLAERVDERLRLRDGSLALTTGAAP